MKVLHLTAFITGGAGIAVMRLHNALLKNGIESKVLCYFAQDKDITEGVYKINPVRPLVARVLNKIGWDKNSRSVKGLNGNYEAFTFPFSDYQLHKHPLVEDADLIHLHWIADFVDIPTFFTNIRKKMIWTAHDLNPLLGGFHYEEDVKRCSEFSKIESKFMQTKHRFIWQSDISFIGSSTITVEKIKEYLPGIPTYKIPCVLDVDGFQPIESEKAKYVLGLSSSGYLILGSGADNLQNYRKGYWLLLEAIDLLSKEERQKIKVLSFGSEDKITANSDLEIIRFEPVHNKRLHSILYSAMDYFVVPSLEETFGLTGTEALLCNTPLISSKTGG
ncbi:MAG: glycosyltransferase, partial [Chryseobacterium sp.]